MLRDRDHSVLILSVICVLLQISLAPNIPIGGITPNLMLIPLVASAIKYGPGEGCVWGFLFGAVCDFSSTGPVGAMMLVMCIIGFVVGTTSNSVPLESWISCLIVLLASSLLTEVARAIFMSTIGSDISIGSSLAKITLPAAVYDTVFGLVAFPLLRNRLSRSSRAAIVRGSTTDMHVDVSQMSFRSGPQHEDAPKVYRRKRSRP